MPPLPRLLRRAALASPLLAACYQGPLGSDTAVTTATMTTATTATTVTTGVDSTGGPATEGGPTTTSPATTAGPGSTGLSGSTSTDSGDMTSETGPIDTGPPDSTGTTGEPVDPGAMVCARWNADRADLSEGGWSGDVNGCAAGDTLAPGRDNALRLLNLYRFLAGLPPVGHDATRDAKAQECALMMHANGQLSHSPPMNWACWSGGGAEAAGSSNISSTPGVLAVDLYMVDPGNDTTLGHRRWLLSNSLGPVGLGSTTINSCLWVIGGQGDAGAAWTAWPPPGVVPIEAIHVPQVAWADVDETGWSLQSDGIDVTKAQITVSEGGVDRPITLTALQGGFGSQYAVSMRPQGWKAASGKTYTVQVDGVPQPFSYEVQVVQCE